MTKGQFYESLAFYYDFICEDRKKDVEILKRLIKRHKKSKGNKLLDVACGTGLEDKYLKKDFRITGIDSSRGVLNIAKRRNPDIAYKISDMRSFKINEKFNVITCFDAMCYLQNYNDFKTALKNFSNHLAPGGVLIFYLDNNFLKEHSTRENILITQKSKGNLCVTLFEIYRRVANRVEGYAIYLIREVGKTRVEVDSLDTLGFFEVHKIRSILAKLGFKTYLYSGDSKRTFSTKKYSEKSPFPIFVCEKTRAM